MLNQNGADNTGDARCPSSQKINTWNEMAREHATLSKEAKETETWRKKLWEETMDAIHANIEQRSKFYRKMEGSLSRKISEITVEDCLNAGYECHKHMLRQRSKQKKINDRLAILNVHAAQWSTRRKRLKEYLTACKGSWQEISTRCQRMAYGIYSQENDCPRNPSSGESPRETKETRWGESPLVKEKAEDVWKCRSKVHAGGRWASGPPNS